MPDLLEKKVGIVACSGEEMAAGLVTRLAALKTLEERRRGQTVTICLPLFLAGGEGDRAFARFYPTIAVDGCDKRCAARATEMYSNKPAASFVVTDFVEEHGLPTPTGLRRLDAGGQLVVERLADALAAKVDELMAVRWSRTNSAALDASPTPAASMTEGAACACAAGIPITRVEIHGQTLEFLALTAIFDMADAQGQPNGEAAPDSLLAAVRLYNPVPAGQESLYAEAVGLAWSDYKTQKASRS